MLFVFRITTLERFFAADTQFSGYGDISIVPEAEQYVWFYLQPLATDNQSIADEIHQYAEMLTMVLHQIPAQKTVMAFTMQELFSLHTETGNRTVAEAIADYNTQLSQLAKQYPNVRILDFSHFASRYTQQDLVDWKYYFMSQMGLNPRLANDFKQWFAQQQTAIALKRKKCLVLDLDNTLWGGILGEDGIDGIQLGGDYPGKAYLYFQKQIKALQQQGVILAVCSKNNLTDVEELWVKHPDCVLQKDDFACLRINWQNKADNLREIAATLNIGIDSFVFIDDNPAERAIVQQELPEVAVPDFPTKPYELPLFFKTLAEQYFSVYALTDEDKSKTEQYRANAQRNECKAQFTDMESYIRSLQIQLKIEPVNDITLPRVAQMTQKTNQFNLTTRRYTEADIRQLIANGAIIYTLSVRDRFGDSGISGLSIIRPQTTQQAEIDTFLMSCRVLGKRIEFDFMHELLQLLKTQGFTTIHATYIPTPKNTQVASFYEQCGFALIETNDSIKRYSYDNE